MIRSIIVDDEPRAIKALQILLERHCRNVSVEGVAHNIAEALVLILRFKPVLVFLDINMPNGSGMDLVEKIRDQKGINVIFTTAYQEYAVKAFRLSAIDYLLKPIDKEELVNAIERYQEAIEDTHAIQMNLLNDMLQNNKPRKIAINTADSLHMVNIDDILYLSSERNYTKLHLDDSTLLASKPLGEFEELLSDLNFFRVHRSYMINLSRVREYQKKKLAAVLDNGVAVEVSRNRKESLSKRLQSL